MGLYPDVSVIARLLPQFDDDMIKGVWAKCPMCGAGIERLLLKYGKPFPCPECKELLFVPLHAGIFAIVGGLVSGSLAYAFGARGTLLVVITCLLVLPGLMVFSGLWTLFVPPTLRPFNGDPDHKPNQDSSPDFPAEGRGQTSGGHAKDGQTRHTN
jgi:hypothetical protein